MKDFLRVLFCCVLFFLLHNSLFSQSRVEITDDFKDQELYDHLSYSTENSIELKQLSNIKFKPVVKGFDYQEVFQDTSWFKFEVVNLTEHIKDLTFTIGNVHFENFSLFKKTEEGILTVFELTKQKGDKRKSFYLEPKESSVFYLKVLHKNTNFHFTPKLTDTFFYQEKLNSVNFLSLIHI